MTQDVPLQDNREFKILDIKDGRCANHNRVDKIFLVAFMSMDGLLQTDITVVVKNEGILIKAAPPVNEGYGAAIFCGRFTDKATEQVLLSFQSTGTVQKHYYLFDFNKPQIKILLDASHLEYETAYIVEFADGYETVVSNVQTNEKHLIDLKYKPKVYLTNLYEADGVLKKKFQGEILPVSDILPVYSYDFKRYHLLVYQKITGINHNDILGFLITRLNWNGYGFQVIDVSTSVLPHKK